MRPIAPITPGTQERRISGTRNHERVPISMVGAGSLCWEPKKKTQMVYKLWSTVREISKIAKIALETTFDRELGEETSV